ncbi:MAG TPA: dTDP-glucose 4,6-dehydratase, partial [Candidatus Tectomicrobia bacterium]
FEPGLKHTIRWYLDHQDWVQGVISGEYLKYYEAVYVKSWGRPA